MKTAVILFNLGGPQTLDDVKPFLFNLFKDKAILNVPALIRYPLAWCIASRREKEAKHIYAALGGGSPLLANTKAQAAALQKELGADFKVFTVMRYWHPFAKDVAKDVTAYAPDKIIYLPLYPQFSTTTTKSSFEDFDKKYFAIRSVPSADGTTAQAKTATPSISKICCYPTQAGLIKATADLIRPIYEYLKTETGIPPRILFSAHGLPEKTITAGDPYQEQVFATTKAVVDALNIPDLDYKNTFQSRVGPLKWIGPYTDAEIEIAGAERLPVMIVPIAFVSEHSETLFEIDLQYRALAIAKGAAGFARVPAVSTHPDFIHGLAELVHEAMIQNKKCTPSGGTKICPTECSKCPCRS